MSQRRQAFWLCTIIGVLLVASAGAFWLGRVTLPPVAVPPPRELTLRSAVTAADFVGAESCAECHTPEFDMWRRFTHGRAGGRPSRALVLGAFDGPPIHFRDAMVVPRVTRAGAFVFEVAQRGVDRMTYAIDGVVGGGHMAGGGTQGFVSRRPDGTYRLLPFEISRQRNG